MTREQPDPVVLFDVDGTLVDSNYQNVLAWHRAFRGVGLVVPAWRIHRHMGMGGDQLVTAVAGEDAESHVGDEVRHLWLEAFAPMVEEVPAVDGATELLEACAGAGVQVVLASSGAAEHVEHYIDLLAGRGLVHAWTTGADVERTKPDPDLLQVARGRSDGGPATMVGDSTWDVEAARRAGLSTITVLTGGFGRKELQDAGSSAVLTSVRQLSERLELLTAYSKR